MKETVKDNIVTAIIATIVIAGGIGYWMGTSRQSPTTVQGGQYSGATQGGSQARRFGSGNNGAMGTIISMDGRSITVRLGGPNATSTNGTNVGTKIILVGSSTQVGKFVQGSIGDLATGDTIMANGTPNSDGSLTASMVQIRPAGSAMGGPRGGQ